MAMLLAMFQKMRLIREINQESMNVVRFTSKLDRITKSIANVQKMYAARIKTLEQQASLGTSIFKYNLNSQYNANDMLAAFMKEKATGTSESIWKAYQDGTFKQEDFDQSDLQAYSQLYQQGQMAVSYQQQQVSMQCQAQEQYVQAQLKAMKEQLEMEQDMALEPLEYEQTLMELDKEASEQRLTRLRAEKDSYDQLLKEEAKEAAPKFGLG